VAMKTKEKWLDASHFRQYNHGTTGHELNSWAMGRDLNHVENLSLCSRPVV
jgi:hypothetical protein